VLVSSFGFLITSLLLPAAGASVPQRLASVPDPDAAAGLDNLDWAPAAGTLLTGGAGSGRPIAEAGVDVPKGSRTQASPDGRESTHRVHNYCPPQQSGRAYVTGRGCFDVFVDDAETDPSASYYYEEFYVSGRAEHAGVTRVKGRNAQDMAENVKWDPGEDRPIGDAVDVTVAVAPITATFKAHPGLIHPYIGQHIFHSSWVSRANRGDPPPSTRFSAGVNLWKVKPGDFVTETGRWEVWFYPKDEMADPGTG
jgi:hypothetical protein